MPTPDKIDQLYDALKADGAVSKSRENFRSYMLASGEQGYRNRKQLYDALKADGAVSSRNYEEFRDRLGLHAVKPQQPVAKPSSTPQPVQQPQKTQPKPQKVKQQPKKAAWKPTWQEKMGMQMQLDETMRQVKQSQQNFNTRMENIRKGNTLGKTSEVKFNPESGKMERRYYTTHGDEVATPLEQSRLNLKYRDEWEATTEEGRRHREKRIQSDFEGRVGAVMDKYDPDNAAAMVWQQAEDKSNEEFGRYLDERSKPSWSNFLRGAVEGTSVTGGLGADNVDTGIKAFATHLKYHDLQRMADDAWNMLGKKKQQSIIEDMYGALKNRYPQATEQQLQQAATEMAREQSDRRMYELAVAKNAPKDAAEYFIRKVAAGNAMGILMQAAARAQAGTTGDREAREDAEQRFEKQGHKVAGIAGTVTGFAIDPLTWASAGAGGAAVKGTTWLGGKMIGEAAMRKFGTTLGGRMLGGAIGGAVNFGTYEAGSEALDQMKWGGYIDEDTGERKRKDGFSFGNVAGRAGHGLMMGAVTGVIAPYLGNVSDKLVRATESNVGKMGIRAGELGVGTVAEGTIFAVPEIINTYGQYGDLINSLSDESSPNYIADEQERAAKIEELRNSRGDALMDVWTDNMAMIAGFKAQHLLKSAPRVIRELSSVKNPRTQEERIQNRMGFESRLRKALDGRPDLALTEDEKKELERRGYGDLKDLTEEYSRYVEAKEEYDKARPTTTDASRMIEGGDGQAELPYNRFVELMTDKSVSEAARAKMYYYLTGHGLPMSTVMGSSVLEDKDADGNVTGYTVQSFGANGVITSRSFGDKKRADIEVNRINRQAELNGFDVGERYFDWQGDNKRMYEACEAVAEETGAPANLLFDLMKRKTEAMNEVELEWAEKILNAYNGLGDKYGSSEVRAAINEEFGVDVDKAIRKERNRRSEQEQKAVDEYANRLFADVKRKQEEAAERGEAPVDPDAPTSNSQIAALLGIDDGEQGDPVSAAFNRGHEADAQERQDIAIELADPNNAEAQEAWNGVVQRINEDAAYMVAQQREQTKQMQHTDGSLRPAILKEKDSEGNDQQVYIVDGNVQMMPDGSVVDKASSDNIVVVYNPVTGERKQIDPSADTGISSLGEVTTAEQREADIERSRQEFVQAQIDEAQGTVRFVPGQQLVLPTGEEAVVVAIDADGENITVALGDGTQTTVQRSELQRIRDEKAAADYRQRHGSLTPDPSPKGEGSEMPQAGAGGVVAGAPADYTADMELTIRDEDGSEKPAMVMGRVRYENGNFVPDANGNIIEYFMDGEVKHDHEDKLVDKVVSHVAPAKPEAETTPTTTEPQAPQTDEERVIREGIAGIGEGLRDAVNEQAAGVRENDINNWLRKPSVADAMRKYGEGAQSVEEVVQRALADNPNEETKAALGDIMRFDSSKQLVQGYISQPQPAQPAEAPAQPTEQPTAEPMPMVDVKGKMKPDWSKATPARAHAYLYNERGLSRENANAFVENNRKAAASELEKLRKKKPEMGTDLDEFEEKTAEWQGKTDEAQRVLDYWQQVRNIQNDIQRVENERRAAEDAVRHDEAVAEEQQRQAEELAKREEQAERGAYAVHPAIREKWEAASKIDGVENEITLANGERVKGHYVLVESGAATPSHNPNAEFARSEGFPVDENGNTVNDRDYERDKEAQAITRRTGASYDSRAIQSVPVVTKDGVVLSGNGRTMAGELAARDNTDGAYIEHLQKYPQQFGFTAEQVSSFLNGDYGFNGHVGHPRVLFVADDAMPYTTETFAKFNAQDMKSQSRTEQSVKLGKTVDDATFNRVIRIINGFDTLGEFYNDTAASTEAIAELRNAGAINAMMYAEIFDGEKVSVTGRQMLENMLIGKAFESNPDAIRQLSEYPAMRQSVISALAEISNNVGLGEEYSLESELAAAISLAYSARKSGTKSGERVSGFARQQNLFQFDEGSTVADYTNATVLMLADVMNDAVSGDDRRKISLKKVLALYNQNAAESAAGQLDIFGGGLKSKENIIKDVLKQLKYGTEEETRMALRSATERRKATATGQGFGETGIQQDGTPPAVNSGSEDAESKRRLADSGRDVERGEGLSEEEADDLILASAERAIPMPEFELTSENWKKEFGDGTLKTPIEHIKIGKNQFSKMIDKGREKEAGLIKPTFTDPDFVIEEASEAADGTTERASSHLYVKSFIGKDGRKRYFFKSVTVKRDGLEVNVSSHFDRPKRLREALKKGKLLYRFDGGAQTEQTPASVSVTTSRTNPGVSFGKKRPLLWAGSAVITPATDSATEPVTTLDAQQGGEQLGSASGQSGLSEGKMLWRTPKDATTASVEQQGLDYAQPSETETATKGSGMTPQSTDMSPSVGKVSENPATVQEKTEKVAENQTPNAVQAALAAAEHETNTEPTEAQKEAGNYKKGHVKIDGYDVTIENPKGSVRSGVNGQTGQRWAITMQNTYGYIRGTEGVDGDHIDVFFSEDPSQGDVFVVDQVNKDGSFDEHKVMYGFPDIESARKAYLSNYEDGWQGLGAITPVSKEEFKKWIDSSHRKTKPFAEYSSVKPLGDTQLGEQPNKPTVKAGEDYVSAAERIARENEVKRTAAHFAEETQEEATAFDKRVPEMDDAELLAYMQEDGRGDLNKAHHPSVYDEYDYRHGDEQLQSYDDTLVRLNESGTTLEQAEEMLANIQKDVSRLATDERVMLLGQEEALQEYIAGLEKEYVLSDPRTMSDEEKERRGNLLRDTYALPVEKGLIISKEGVTARKAAENWWVRNVGAPRLYETEAGVVVINLASVDDSLAHGYSQAKLDAITSLPDGFSNAVYLGSMEDADRRATMDHYFAYPIDYDGKRRYVFCRALHDNNTNRLYVHEVFVADSIKKGNTLQTAASKPHGGIALYRDILANVLKQAEREGGHILILPSDNSKEAGGLSSRTLDLSSIVKGSDLFGNEQRKVKKSSSETKIDDVGEVLAGARKDMRKEIAKSLANVTEAALVEKPFGKVYKKPDLKKAVESGALREKDAIFYEALFSMVNQQKPKVTQSEMRSKRYIPDHKTKAERWAADTFKQMEVLRQFMELDEPGRDAMMERMLADRYPTREQELAEIEKRKGWNPDYEGHKYEWGEMTTPNPLWVTHEVMNRLGYSVGDKLDVPYGVVKANTSGTGYSIENLKGERASLFGSGMTLDEAIDRIVYLAKLKRGDADVSHPTQLFAFPATKSESGESGRYRVMWGRDYKTREFDSKDEADAFAQTKNGAYVSPIMETKRKFGYKVRFTHPLTGEKMFVDDTEFDTKEEAQAYFDGNFEKLNEATNAKLQEEREKKGEKKTLTVDDVVHVTMVHSEGGWTHAVVIDKKYANNDGQVRIIKEGFASRKDAKSFADSVKDDVLKTVLKHKEDAKKIVYFDTGENSRIGEDYRNGKNVDAEDFMNTFGFRGVQFGNWTNQADRQMAVNQAYDAFMDMARLIGVSPKAMSLNGELGIAFGARGVGGFAAHYEPGEVVINLTKTQGAGSLAHEWWHALDNYFARRAGSVGDMVTDNRRIEMRDALRKAFNDMLDLVNGSDYAQRSAAKGEYWGRTHEITARLLAEWVDRELKKRGELNTFLSRGAVVERGQQHNYDVYEVLERLAGREPMPFEEYKELPESLKGIPYPSAKEVEQFGASLRHIFDTLEEQVDEETGNVALLHKATSGVQPTELTEREVAFRDALVDTMRDAGIEVNVSAEEGQRVLDMVNGEAKLMGSRTNKKMANIGEAFEGRELTEQQQKVVDVFRGKSDNTPIEVERADGKVRVIMRQGNDEKAGTKHSLYGHYGTNKGVITDEDILIIPDVLARGERTPKMRGNTQLYEYTLNGENGTRYTVLTEKKHSREEFADFYTNKKTSQSARKTRSEEARDIDNNDVSSAKLQQNSDTSKEMSGKIREHRVYHGSGADFDAFDHSHKVKFFRTRDGKAFGYTYNGKMYIDPRIATSETPVHEYAHLWAETLRRSDPQLWEEIKGVLLHDEAVKPFIDKVRKEYPEVKDEDELLDEVLAQYSGKRGAGRLRKAAEEIAGENPTLDARALARAAMAKVKSLLEKFWRSVAKVFGWKYSSAAEIADKVLSDLLSGVNPKLETAIRELSLRHNREVYPEQPFDTPNIRNNSETQAQNGENLLLGRDGLDELPKQSTRFYSAKERREREAYAERQWRRAHEVANEIIDKLNISDDITVYESIDEVPGSAKFPSEQRRSKGWYDPRTNKIVVVLGNHRSPNDVKQTILHEAVAHYGLRKLFGKNFETFLDNVYKHADMEVRRRIISMAANKGWDIREATEEYLASLAEDTDFDNAERRSWAAGHWFNKIKQLFLDMLHHIGLRDYDGGSLTDNELRYILWRSYKNLAEPGHYRNYSSIAEDTVMQSNLHVGYFTEETGQTIEQMTASVAEVGFDNTNERFNEQLNTLTKENAREILLNCGMPSDILLSCGIENKPIRLYGAKLLSKAVKHGYNISLMRNLPKTLANPVAVFSGSNVGSYAILTELQYDGKNILATLSVGKGGHDVDFNIISSVYDKRKDSIVKWVNSKKLLYVNKEKALNYISVSAPIAEAQYNEELNSAANIIKGFVNPKINRDNIVFYRDGEYDDDIEQDSTMQEDRDMMRSAVQQMGEKLHTNINIIEDVNEITHPNAEIQEQRRRAKGWYDRVTRQVYVVLPNNRDVDDAKATTAHETIAHKGLRELVGEDNYNDFLDETYKHLRDDLKKGVDAAAGRAFIDDTTKNGKRAKSYEQHRHTAVDELFGRMAEKPFEEFSEGERTLWQKMCHVIRRLLDKFLGTLKLPKWFELGDNELRYMLWRSKERLERGKEHPIDLARDIVKREELGLTDEARYNMGDAPETFKARQRRAVENKGTVMPGLNGAQVKVVGNIPRHTYTGNIAEATQQAIDAAKAKYVPNGEPRTLHYNNFGAEFDYSISGNAIETVLSAKHQGKSVNKGVHLALAEHLDRVIGESIEVEEHPDRIKAGDVRDNSKINPDALMHRFYGVANIDGVDYCVMTLMKEENKAKRGNGIHSYEVQKIEVLDEETPNTSNGVGTLNSELEGYPLSKVIKDVGKTMEKDKNLLEQSKLADESTDLYRDPYETEDIWTDGSLGLDEMITRAAVRLSDKHRADKTMKMDAMRAICDNLADLAKSMLGHPRKKDLTDAERRSVDAKVDKVARAQMRFDQTTVKRVNDLARVLISSGYLNNLTAGEVKRLLSAVKNSVGHNDIEGDVQKVMDIMVDNQLKHAEDTLHELEAIRGSKVDARGVEVQGQLDPAGAHTMKVFKKTRGWEKTDIEEAISEAQQRMGSSDVAVADEAALEYTGLQLALEYAENIKDSKVEERKLREEIKQAHDDASERERATDSYRQYIASLQEAIRQNKIERAQSYFDLVGRLSDSLRESIANAKDFKEAEKQRIREIQHNANSDMEGRPSDEHLRRTHGTLKALNNIFGNTLFAPLATFDQMLRMFGGKSANGEGYLYNRFMRGWVDARQKEINGVRDKYAILDAKAAELFGGKVKTWGDLIRRVGKLPKGTVSFWNGGEIQERELTQGNLMYIYMVNKMLDGRMKLRKMGITEENVADIEEVLDPRLIELADWLQDEFLVQTRNEYNETHKRMFGASMAAIEHYFPLKILANARADKPEDLDNPDKSDGISTATGSIIKRRRNALALDITGADALSVILDHVAQMEHWNAFAEFNRDINTLRTYKRFRNQVQNMTTIYGNGEELWKRFNDVCQMAAGTYRPPRTKLDKGALEFAQGVTAAKVSFRMFTALKQFLSMPAYIPEARADYLAANILNPAKAWKWSMEHLPIFSERWRSRVSGDPRLAKSGMDWRDWRANLVQRAARWGMSPNAFVDALTVSIGAHSMYQTRLAQYLRDGYSEADAEKKAVQDAEVLYNQTQQSSEGAFTSTMQVDRSWLSVLFTVFRNASMSYQRQLHDAFRNFKHNLTPGGRARSIEFMTKQLLRDKGIEPQTDGNWSDADWQREEQVAKRKFRRQLLKDTLRVATFGYIMQWAWNLGAYLPYLLFGDDEDEKQKMWDDVWAHTAFGSVEGLTGGDLMSQAGQMMLTGEGNPAYLSKDMPLTSDVMTAFQKLGNGQHTEAFNDIVNIVVQAGIGVNPQSITDTVLAIMDACGDDPALAHEAIICIFRILQVPQSQIDKMYFDEVGLSGANVSKYSIEDLVRRYAAFKLKRGRFSAPWSWNDTELEEKYMKKGEKIIRERVSLFDDNKLQEKHNTEDIQMKKIVGKEAAKRLGGTDSYGSPQNEYGQVYLQMRDYVDLAEDVTLQTALKNAKERGDTDRVKDIESARRQITEVKKDLADAPYNLEDGTEVTAIDIMQELRDLRKSLMIELGITTQQQPNR